jgi:hypothetical protein
MGTVWAWVRNGALTLLALGIGYGVWLYFNGNPAEFMTTIANIGGAIIGVIAHIVSGLLGALHVPHKS